MSTAETTDTSEHEQQFMEGTEPVKIPKIEKAAKALRKISDMRRETLVEKKECKKKLREAMEESIDQLPKRWEGGVEIAFYKLAGGLEAILEPKIDDAKIGKAKAKKMADEVHADDDDEPDDE